MDDLKKELKEIGVTLKQVANACGESQSTVSRILNNNLRVKIESVARSLRDSKAKKVSEVWLERSDNDRVDDISAQIRPTLQWGGATFVENSINQNYIKKRLRNIAIEVAKTRNVQGLKNNKTDTFTDVVDTPEQQLSGFGVLLKTVMRTRKYHAIIAEF